jgi:hypothetical protein
MDTGLEVRGLLDRLQQAAWELAALAIALRGEDVADDDLIDNARLVLTELGLMSPTPNGARPAPGLADLIAEAGSNFASETAAPLLQCAGLLSGSTGWTTQSDDALLAQGRASAQAAAPFKQFILPALDGLADLFAEASPAMLDVGVGVAAMAVEYCRTFPTLRVVGIDVLPRALELARGVSEEAGVADRIELRNQDVATLEDLNLFALAWLPAPFVPRAALEAGVSRIVAALVPGGWLVVGHGKFQDDELKNAINRLKTSAYGGTPLDDDKAQTLLRDAGLELVWTLPTPEGVPALTVGRRPK